MILIILCASYLLSAGLLTWARLAGQIVPLWKITAWLVTGSIGMILLYWLAPHRPLISIAIFLTLAPWMAFALFEDARSHHYIIAGVDAAGLFAIAFSLWLII